MVFSYHYGGRVLTAAWGACSAVVSHAARAAHKAKGDASFKVEKRFMAGESAKGCGGPFVARVAGSRRRACYRWY